MKTLDAPFPWFGGKRRVANLVWSRLGDVKNYVEPFFGSGAVLLRRPDEHRWWERIETINDLDGYVANFWRAISHAPDEVAEYAIWPVLENDLHARHIWLHAQRNDLTRKLEGDPEYYDAKTAGWWVWGICAWIGSGWCSLDKPGPWNIIEDETGKRLLRVSRGGGIVRQRPHLTCGGMGVHGSSLTREAVFDWFRALANRLERVRVCCGDWRRICGHTPTVHNGLTGVFLDPPYITSERDNDLYSADTDCASAVRDWAVEHGDNPNFRIALCGYEGTITMPDTWEEVAWKTSGGYGNQSKLRGRANANRERIWFSPHCLTEEVII